MFPKISTDKKTGILVMNKLDHPTIYKPEAVMKVFDIQGLASEQEVAERVRLLWNATSDIPTAELRNCSKWLKRRLVPVEAKGEA